MQKLYQNYNWIVPQEGSVKCGITMGKPTGWPIVKPINADLSPLAASEAACGLKTCEAGRANAFRCPCKCFFQFSISSAVLKVEQEGCKDRDPFLLPCLARWRNGERREPAATVIACASCSSSAAWPWRSPSSTSQAYRIEVCTYDKINILERSSGRFRGRLNWVFWIGDRPRRVKSSIPALISG